MLLEEGVLNCNIYMYIVAQAIHLEKCISCNLVLIREARSFGISMRPHPHPEGQTIEIIIIYGSTAIKLTGAG